jgi:hypothetical protein
MVGNHVRVRVRVASRIPGLGPPDGRIWITGDRRRCIGDFRGWTRVRVRVAWRILLPRASMSRGLCIRSNNLRFDVGTCSCSCSCSCSFSCRCSPACSCLAKPPFPFVSQMIFRVICARFRVRVRDALKPYINLPWSPLTHSSILSNLASFKHPAHYTFTQGRTS